MVQGLPSLQEEPGIAGPFGTLLQSTVTGVPTHWQFEFKTSLVVFALPSLQAEPIWPATLGQLSWLLHTPSPSLSGAGVPAHWQLACSTSLMVQGLPSLQEEPGIAGPFGTLLQSTETGVPTHWQFEFKTSLVVFALPSLHAVPGKALPPGTPLQSMFTGVPTHWQLELSTSFMVFALPSLQEEPIWPGTLGQLSWLLHTPSPSLSGLGLPKHWQLALYTSFTVQGSPSLQEEPGTALPPTTPLQSAVAVPAEVACTPRERSK